MEYAAYDTGTDYLVVQLVDGKPSLGLLVDRDWGTFAEDVESFQTGNVRLGSVKLGSNQAAKIAAKARFLGKMRDGKLVEWIEADGGWRIYACLQSEEE